MQIHSYDGMSRLSPTKGSYDYLRDKAQTLLDRKHYLLEQMELYPDSLLLKQKYNECLCDIERLRFRIQQFKQDCKKYIEEHNDAHDIQANEEA